MENISIENSSKGLSFTDKFKSILEKGSMDYKDVLEVMRECNKFLPWMPQAAIMFSNESVGRNIVWFSENTKKAFLSYMERIENSGLLSDKCKRMIDEGFEISLF